MLICFSLAEGIPDPAVVFLSQTGRQRGWAPKADDELALMVYDAYLAADTDDIIALCDFDSPRDSPALASAVGIVEQWRCATWAKPQNKKGVASPSAAVLDHFEERRVAIPEPVRPRPWGTSASGASRMRLTRWRHRWGGRIAKLRPREIVPLDVMQSKAPLAYRSSGPMGLMVVRCSPP